MRGDRQLRVPVSKILVEGRHRVDPGDIRALADSIAAVGLLHPPVVRPLPQTTLDGHEYVLVAGARRLAALELLGVKAPPVTYREITGEAVWLQAELDENVQRKPFTPSEAVGLARAIEEAREAGDLAVDGRTRDVAAVAAGMSGRTLDKAAAVVAAAADESLPADVRDVALAAKAEMDATGKVDAAYRRTRDAVDHADKVTCPGCAGRYDRKATWVVAGDSECYGCQRAATPLPAGIVEVDADTAAVPAGHPDDAGVPLVCVDCEQPFPPVWIDVNGRCDECGTPDGFEAGNLPAEDVDGSPSTAAIPEAGVAASDGRGQVPPPPPDRSGSSPMVSRPPAEPSDGTGGATPDAEPADPSPTVGSAGDERTHSQLARDLPRPAPLLRRVVPLDIHNLDNRLGPLTDFMRACDRTSIEAAAGVAMSSNQRRAALDKSRADALVARDWLNDFLLLTRPE